MENVYKRISNLLTIKSIITLVLTLAFAYQALTNQISQDFMMIYTMIIAFYFGTQSKKSAPDNPTSGGDSLNE